MKKGAYEHKPSINSSTVGSAFTLIYSNFPLPTNSPSTFKIMRVQEQKEVQMQ